MLCLLAMTLVFGQSITYEYWLDANYQKRKFGTGSTESISYNVDFSTLSSGVHFLNFRAKSASGAWGSVMRQIFVVPDANGDITQYEYWVDGDYNHRVSKTNNAGDVQTTIDISNLSSGIHFINFRAKPASGTWGSVMRQIFVIPDTNGDISQYEYWIDGDYNHRVSKTNNGGDVQTTIDISNLSSGIHFINFRAKPASGTWGSVMRQIFVVPDVSGNINRFESWIDSDYSHRKMTASTSSSIVDPVDISSLSSGLHFYNLRIQDSNGIWGHVERYIFWVPERNAQLELAAIEYWIDDQNPTVNQVTGTSIQLTVNIGMLEAGEHQFNCRVQASNGNWSSVHSDSFVIEAPDSQHIETPVPQEAYLEYFIDIDPGYGKATILKEIGAGSNELEFELGSVKPGAHMLYVRSKDEQGRWSTTISRPLYVREPISLVALEYFFDDKDPGQGKGVQIAPPKDVSKPYEFEVLLGNLPVGEHHLNVRAKGSDGIWTALSSSQFTLVENTGIIELDSHNEPSITYTIKGYKGKESKGVTIVRYNNGTTKKVILK